MRIDESDTDGDTPLNHPIIRGGRTATITSSEVPSESDAIGVQLAELDGDSVQDVQQQQEPQQRQLQMSPLPAAVNVNDLLLANNADGGDDQQVVIVLFIQ